MTYWTWRCKTYLDGTVGSIDIQMPEGTVSNRTLTQKLRQLTGKAYTIHFYGVI